MSMDVMADSYVIYAMLFMIFLIFCFWVAVEREARRVALLAGPVVEEGDPYAPFKRRQNMTKYQILISHRPAHSTLVYTIVGNSLEGCVMEGFRRQGPDEEDWDMDWGEGGLFIWTDELDDQQLLNLRERLEAGAGPLMRWWCSEVVMRRVIQ